MSRRQLPTSTTALHLLRKEGKVFPEAFLEPVGLGVMIDHPEKGRIEVRADPLVVSAIDTLFVADRKLFTTIQDLGGRAAAFDTAFSMIRKYFRARGEVWGTAGYASGGYPYREEVQGLRILYRFLKREGRLPNLVTDGASAVGVLGINGIVAHELGIPTFGASPLGGLHKMAVRTYMICFGLTYEDREKLVGLLADILTCWGGKDGTFREARAALEHGGIVLLMRLSKYNKSFMNSTSHMAELETVARQNGGTIITCDSLDDIPIKAREALTVFDRAHNRDRRLAAINQELRR